MASLLLPATAAVSGHGMLREEWQACYCLLLPATAAVSEGMLREEWQDVCVAISTTIFVFMFIFVMLLCQLSAECNGNLVMPVWLHVCLVHIYQINVS